MDNPQQLMQAIRDAHAAGDTGAVRRLGARLMALKSEAEFRTSMDPTKDMSTTQRFLAGAGKGMTDLARGVGQLFGGYTREDIDEINARDAALTNTTAGTVGNITGTVAAGLPTMFIPGAQGLVGATAVGAATGALQPVGTDDSRFDNALKGGAGAALGVGAGRALAAGAKGAKALIEPFTQGGREKIAARTLAQFGIDPAAVATAAGRAGPTTTGARLTLAEAIDDPTAAAAAAKLQDALEAADPRTAVRLGQRKVEANAARVNTLRDLAGTGGRREFFDASREAGAKDAYGAAFRTPMDASALSAAERGEITKLLQTDAVKEAMKQARKQASNLGMRMDDTNGSVEGLHMLKLAMDDMISNAGKTANEANKAANIQAVRDRLVTFIERMSPDYAAARATYREMSRPINQMDVAGKVLQRGSSATSDLGGNPRLMPDGLLRAVGDEEQLIKQAVGRNIKERSLADLLEPEQLAKLKAVTGEVDKLAAVERAGAGRGSATASRLASNNLLRQVLGPTGMPERWSESTLLATLLGRPAQFIYNGVAEPRIHEVLADAILDPALAAQLMPKAVSGGQRLINLLPGRVQEGLPVAGQAARLLPGAAFATNE